jgi:hypothetical protein
MESVTAAGTSFGRLTRRPRSAVIATTAVQRRCNHGCQHRHGDRDIVAAEAADGGGGVWARRRDRQARCGQPARTGVRFGPDQCAGRMWV